MPCPAANGKKGFLRGPVRSAETAEYFRLPVRPFKHVDKVAWHNFSGGIYGRIGSCMVLQSVSEMEPRCQFLAFLITLERNSLHCVSTKCLRKGHAIVNTDETD
jgi:hypothetical protein